MPLTKQQKQDALAAIQEQLDGANTLYLTDYKGLTVEEVTRLRRAFRNANIEYSVLKNTLLRRALEARGGYGDLLDQLHGPTAVAFTNDASAPAKVIQAFLKGRDKELPRFKGAYVDGAVFGEGSLETLAALKSREELIADVIALLLSPIRTVVGAIQAPGATLAGAIKQIAEKDAA